MDLMDQNDVRLIKETGHSVVLMTRRKGEEVIIKRSRESENSRAVTKWHNEVKMLKNLEHVDPLHRTVFPLLTLDYLPR